MEKLFKEFCKDQDKRSKLMMGDSNYWKVVLVDMEYNFRGINSSFGEDMMKIKYGIIKDKTLENALIWKQKGKPTFKELDVTCSCHEK